MPKCHRDPTTGKRKRDSASNKNTAANGVSGMPPRCCCAASDTGYKCVDQNFSCARLTLAGIDPCPDHVLFSTGSINDDFIIPLCGTECDDDGVCIFSRGYCGKGSDNIDGTLLDALNFKLYTSKLARNDYIVTLVGSPSGGDFKLLVKGIPTAPIPFNASAADLAAIILAIPGISAVTVTGAVGGPWTIVFGLLSNGIGPFYAVALLSNSLTGGSAPHPTLGATPHPFHALALYVTLGAVRIGCCAIDCLVARDGQPCEVSTPPPAQSSIVLYGNTSIEVADIDADITITNLTDCGSFAGLYQSGFNGTATVRFVFIGDDDEGDCPPTDNGECDAPSGDCPTDCIMCDTQLYCPDPAFTKPRITNLFLSPGICDDCEGGVDGPGCCVHDPHPENCAVCGGDPMTACECGVQGDKDSCITSGGTWCCDDGGGGIHSPCNALDFEAHDIDIGLASHTSDSLTFTDTFSTSLGDADLTIVAHCGTIWEYDVDILIDGRCHFTGAGFGTASGVTGVELAGVDEDLADGRCHNDGTADIEMIYLDCDA